ncbi:hypothetical protein [Kytococcus sedentarius]|uniref:hypothetical protein n=1 Tax=Kytococcus sedentarius TaxID=1276 RepID=UPI0035BC1449
MTTAPWSGPRGLRGLRGRNAARPVSARGARGARTTAPVVPGLRPAEWGRAVGTAAGTGVRSARGYVTTCSRKAFAILCAVIVVGAMVASLVFNTARGEGAFQLAEAESSHRQATETRLSLEAQVDEMSSPEQLSARAEQLGMVPAGTMGYVDPGSGAVLGEAEAAPDAPATGSGPDSGSGAAATDDEPDASSSEKRKESADEGDTSDKDKKADEQDKKNKDKKKDDAPQKSEKDATVTKDEQAKQNDKSDKSDQQDKKNEKATKPAEPSSSD